MTDRDDGYEPYFTMPVGLRAAGWKTGLFTSNSRCSPAYGVGLGFEDAYYGEAVRSLVEEGEPQYATAALLRAFEPWLAQNKDSRFFAYVHFMPPHIPYDTPEEIVAQFAGQDPPGYSEKDYQPGKFDFPVRGRFTGRPLPEWINLYDAHLRYGDSAVADLERLLREAGVLENTLFIVTSDHGEAFGEHGFLWHKRAIHDEATHVPLIVRFPGGAVEHREYDALTQTIDLLPTVYDLFGMDYPRKRVQGHSLVPLLTGQAEEVNDYSVTRSGRPDKYMVRDHRYSLLLYEASEHRYLYDNEKDPRQKRNILRQNAKKEEELIATFEGYALEQQRPVVAFLDLTLSPAPAQEEGRIKLTPEQEREMRALGYLR
jgi:arylsulfatase A-like enzyme